MRVGLAGAALLLVMLVPQPWLKGVAALLVFTLAVFDAEPWVYLAALCIPFAFARASVGPLRFSPADVAVWAAFIGWASQAIRRDMQPFGVEAFGALAGQDRAAGNPRLQRDRRPCPDPPGPGKPRFQASDAAVAFLLLSGALSLLAAPISSPGWTGIGC